tara:strand:+ start:944 stop:1825 length:882 start_codon:yes stop_codon:yes gene_type:complete
MENNEFTAKIDGEDVVFKVKNPSFKDQREAQKVYNRAFSDAISSGCIIRARLDEIMTRQGLWDEEKDKQFKELQTTINDGEKALAAGGIGLQEAKDIAVKMRQARADLKDLISTKNNLDNNTAEGQADNAKFNYLVSVCVVYKESGKPYFSGYEDYLNRSTDRVGIEGSFKLANAIYGLEENFETKLPENKFLLDYDFVDEDLNFIDKKGRLVDSKGRLIDKDGRFIDEEGNFVDIEGNKVNFSGQYVAEFTPFLDDKGKPVVLKDKEKSTEEQPEEPEKPKPRRRRKKQETN